MYIVDMDIHISPFRCVMSVGIRCFTEIFLNKMGYKRFSSPFDATYLSSISDIIYILKNNINKHHLIYTQDYPKYDTYNKSYGFRTIHTKLDNTLMKPNDTHSKYHYCTFPHHNLKEQDTYEHFERCFHRLRIIEKYKIKTLFCLFIHPHYAGYVHITHNDIHALSTFLTTKFNCHLLVCYFEKTNSKQRYIKNIQTNTYSIFTINNNSHIYEHIQEDINNIMKDYIPNKSTLISYTDIHNYTIN